MNHLRDILGPLGDGFTLGVDEHGQLQVKSDYGLASIEYFLADERAPDSAKTALRDKLDGAGVPL